MTPELQNALASFLVALLDTMKQGGDLVLSQAPLIIQEKIAYERFAEPLTFCFWAGIALLSHFTFKRLWPKARSIDMENNDDGLTIATGLGWGLSVTISSLIALSYVYATAKVWIAPRVYIIEWLTDLLKNNS